MTIAALRSGSLPQTLLRLLHELLQVLLALPLVLQRVNQILPLACSVKAILFNAVHERCNA